METVFRQQHKKNGVNVIATDICEELINLTRQYAKDNDLPFPTKRLSWQELPHNFGVDFDIVFCYGNSICHSIDITNEDNFQLNSDAYSIILGK